MASNHETKEPEPESPREIVYPTCADGYELTKEIGRGAFGTVHEAKIIQDVPGKGELVAIKILDLDALDTSWDVIEKEIKLMRMLDHPNVIPSYCSFVEEAELWLVMPLLNGGSCAAIMKQRFTEGFDDETLVATILRETLRGLQYLHSDSRIHRDVKAGNILLSRNGEVRVADFGVAGCLMDAGQKKGLTKTFTGTPAWMAPEVMEQVAGHNYKADIWSFAITALELAYGKPPYAHHAPMKILMLTLQSDPPSTSTYGEKAANKFSKSFKSLVSDCLKKEVAKRPSAKDLLKHKFFKKARDASYIQQALFPSKDDPPRKPTVDRVPSQPQDAAPQKISRKPISLEAFDFLDDGKASNGKKSNSETTMGRFTVEIED